MKENIKYFETLNDANGYIINDIPFTSYIKENRQVIFNNKPNKILIDQNGQTIVHDKVDVVFNTLAEANGHIIETIPFSCYIKENKQLVYCNEPNKQLKLENGKIIIVKAIEFVDLGLSVKWAKYNYGVNSEQLTTASDWYGKYLMWGELEEKSGWDGQGTKIPYDWSNYKYTNGASNKLTKYCNKSTYGNNGFTDNLTQLVPEDDVTTVNYGGNWRMPTQTELTELKSLSNQWVTNYNGISGLNGQLFNGTNGNQLFIPASGYRRDSGISGVGSYCCTWSNSLDSDSPYGAWCLHFYSGGTYLGFYYRCLGFSVRPVC